jgi:hypothetical protein
LTPADGQLHHAEEGLIIVEPAIGTITEAYLVIENRLIPEPAAITIGIVGLIIGAGACLRRTSLRQLVHHIEE